MNFMANFLIFMVVKFQTLEILEKVRQVLPVAMSSDSSLFLSAVDSP